MNNQRNRLFHSRVAHLAHLALIEELNTTPKPGLVDKNNSGAHTDMNYDTFVKSANAIAPHFALFSQAGEQTARLPADKVLEAARPLGIAAEEAMFAATGGVNTHKGAIFSLGLLCLSAGRLGARGQSTAPPALCRMTQEITWGISQKELPRPDKANLSAGERMYARYGVKGARGEAESGFSNARTYGLRPLRDFLRRGYDKNTAYLRALLSLMANVTDTNVLNRKDMDTALLLKSRAGALQRRFSIEKAAALDRDLIRQNISPGGSADLLAVSIFLHYMSNDNHNIKEKAEKNI